MFAHQKLKYVRIALIVGMIMLTGTACSHDETKPTAQQSEPSEREKRNAAGNKLRKELNEKDLQAKTAREKTVPELTSQYAAKLSATVAALGDVAWYQKLEAVTTFYCTEQRSEEYTADLARDGWRDGSRSGHYDGRPDARVGYVEALQAASKAEYQKHWQASTFQQWSADFTSAVESYGCSYFGPSFDGRLQY